MKKKTKILSLLIALVLICCSGVTVNAASTANAKAHAALKRQLKADKQRSLYSDSKMRYAYADINGDHIDELITEPGYGYLTQAIYSYKNRTIKPVAAVGQGTFTKYYPKHKVIYIKNSGHMGYLCDYYYKQSKTGVYKLVAQVGKDYGSRSYDSKPIKTTYYIGNKKTSKAKYSQYIKKMLKGEKGKNFSSLKWKRY